MITRALILIGVDKARTSWLYQTIMRSMEFNRSHLKDTEFLSHHRLTTTSYDNYCKIVRVNDVIIDFSHNYFFSDTVPENIAYIRERLPVKVILLIRRPSDRFWSDILFQLRSGQEQGAVQFDKALKHSSYSEIFNGWNGGGVEVYKCEHLENNLSSISEFLGMEIKPIKKVINVASKARSRKLAALAVWIMGQLRRFNAFKLAGFLKNSGLLRTILFQKLSRHSASSSAEEIEISDEIKTRLEELDKEYERLPSFFVI